MLVEYITTLQAYPVVFTALLFVLPIYGAVMYVLMRGDSSVVVSVFGLLYSRSYKNDPEFLLPYILPIQIIFLFKNEKTLILWRMQA